MSSIEDTLKKWGPTIAMVATALGAGIATIKFVRIEIDGETTKDPFGLNAIAHIKINQPEE